MSTEDGDLKGKYKDLGRQLSDAWKGLQAGLKNVMAMAMALRDGGWRWTGVGPGPGLR